MQHYDVIAGVLGVDTVTLNEKSNALNTPNWDSLRHIELILAIENAYNIRFAITEVMNMKNLGDLREILEVKGADFGNGAEIRLSA